MKREKYVERESESNTGEIEESREREVDGVEVSRVYGERKKNLVQQQPAEFFFFLIAWKLHENDKNLELVDETLDTKDYTAEEVKNNVEIALMCTQSSAALRPSMSEVVVLLRSK
ncbi:Cysteine-rich receptor-like protein kinase 2 [Fagus crenata]